MGEEKPKSDSNLGLFLGVAILIGGIYKKVSPVLEKFWQEHYFQIYFLIGLLLLVGVIYSISKIWNKFIDKTYELEITKEAPKAVFLGEDENHKKVYLRQQFRSTHTQVIGTTSAGKTESVILPWAINDIENGNGLIIVDGKSDRSFLEKLYGYVIQSKREADFRLFSLAAIEPSSTFNPLANGSPQEVAERVFSSFQFENEYYKNIQFKIFLALIRLIHCHGRMPSFALVHRLMTDADALSVWIQNIEDKDLKRELEHYKKTPEKERLEKVSGLDATLGHFTTGELSVLFNSENPHIDLNQALQKNQILYFQLPSMYYPFLSQVTGKLLLQCFQSAVARRHLGLTGKPEFFSCYLDDFQDYIYPGFGSLLNKSRSANVGVVFSHQALGDLDNVSSAFRNIVLTNTNIKVVMRNNNPETCEYFAKSFGTRQSEKLTERQESGTFGSTKTGDGSVRDVEEYIYHPNQIKQLATGQGIVSIPHLRGVKFTNIKFERRDDIEGVILPSVSKSIITSDELIKLPSSKDEIQESRMAA